MDKLDILNREEFVEKLFNLTQQLSFNKKNASFAIDGSWGVGKSFVLDMYEEKLSQEQSEETNKDRYFVIRYNCWKYDYYEEPLIAIVSAMIETIEQKTKLFPDNAKKSKQKKKQSMNYCQAICHKNFNTGILYLTRIE